jgi:hypothetical protein
VNRVAHHTLTVPAGWTARVWARVSDDAAGAIYRLDPAG